MTSRTCSSTSRDLSFSQPSPIHPAYYFLTQVKDELIRLGDEIKSSKYLHPEGIAEIHFDLGLLSAKVLHYAGHYGCSTSPSWTLAKDVPNDIINAIITSGVNAPLLIHMAQMHIYYMAYIETFWPHLDTTTLRHAQFQFLGEDAIARTTIYTGYIIAYKDNFGPMTNRRTTILSLSMRSARGAHMSAPGWAGSM